VLTMRDVNGLDAADVGDGCSTYVEQMRATIAAIGRLTPADVPRELQRRLVDVFRTWKSA
jgi:hypothetical protein